MGAEMGVFQVADASTYGYVYTLPPIAASLIGPTILQLIWWFQFALRIIYIVLKDTKL